MHGRIGRIGRIRNMIFPDERHINELIGGQRQLDIMHDRARIIFDIYDVMEEEREIVRNVHNNVRGVSDVHDHQIQESLRNSVMKLKTWYNNLAPKTHIGKDNTFIQIKEYLFGEYNEKYDKKEMVYSTIRSIEKINAKLVATNMTETEILQMVWQRINAPINRRHCTHMRDNLFELLADASIRLDSPYCLVGRITRMVQSLQCYDAEKIVDIKSTNVIAEEIQSKIPLLIKQYFEEHADQRDAYNNGDDTITNSLKTYVYTIINGDYPEAGPDVQKLITSHIEVLGE